jgi:hypothetical protein
MGRETSRLSAAAGATIVGHMEAANTRQMNPARRASALALLVAALISASAVHAAAVGFAAPPTAGTVN